MPYLHPRRRRQLLLWSLVDAALGIVLVASPPPRLSSPAWNTAKSVAPMTTWGWVAFTVGLSWLAVALAGNYIPWPRAGYLIAIHAAVLGAWHAFFWMALVFASVPQGKIALTGCVIYLGVAVQHVLLAVDQV